MSGCRVSLALALLIVGMRSTIAAGQTKPPGAAGRLHLTFTQPSPLSDLATMSARAAFKGDLARDVQRLVLAFPAGSPERGIFEYDLSRESFEAFVPLEC